MILRIDNLDVQLDYDLILNGGGEGAGGIRVTASEIRIATAGGLLESVEADLVDVLPFRQALDQQRREEQQRKEQEERPRMAPMQGPGHQPALPQEPPSQGTTERLFFFSVKGKKTTTP